MRLPLWLWEQMRQDMIQHAPEEACGLLGGGFNGALAEASHIWPMEHTLHSPVRYRLDPRQQLAVFDTIDSLGLTLTGIYHSHPCGPDHPSPTDLAEAYYPEVVYLIWSGSRGAWQCQGFTIQAGVAHPVSLETYPQKV